MTDERVQTDPPPSDDEIATAYHEAGHAVVALSQGRLVEKITIVRNTLRLGQVQLGKGRRGRPNDYLESEVMILFGGLVSEARYTGQYAWRGAQQDMWAIRRLTLSRAGSTEKAERIEQRLLDKTEHWIDQPGHWLAIEAIVAELIKSRAMSGRAARHLFDQTMKPFA